MLMPKWIFYLLVAALVLSSLSTVLAGNTLFQVRQVTADNAKSICATVEYYNDRIDDTKAFLENHPGKEPIPGISRATLERGIASNQGLIDALTSYTECPPHITPVP